MILRTWRGAVRAEDADEYGRYVDATGLTAYSKTPGNLGAAMVRRPSPDDGGATTEFLVLSYWESMDAVKRFAGPTPETAVFYPEDERFLVRRDLTVDHYEVDVRRDSATAR